MTTLHATIASFSTSLSDIFADMSRAAIQHDEAKLEKARLAEQIKAVSAFDAHLLDDIGLKDFHLLPLAEQERLLRGHSAR